MFLGGWGDLTKMKPRGRGKRGGGVGEFCSPQQNVPRQQRLTACTSTSTYLETLRGRRDAQCPEGRAVPVVDGSGEGVRLAFNGLQVAQDGVHISSGRGERSAGAGAGAGEEDDEGRGPVGHLERIQHTRAREGTANVVMLVWRGFFFPGFGFGFG